MAKRKKNRRKKERTVTKVHDWQKKWLIKFIKLNNIQYKHNLKAIELKLRIQKYCTNYFISKNKRKYKQRKIINIESYFFILQAEW